MFMSRYGSFQQCWESCFGGYQSPDPVDQQIVELSTLVGYGLRGFGMTTDNQEISNLDHGDMSVIVYYPPEPNIYVPFLVRSVMLGEGGSVSETIVSLLNGDPPSAAVPPDDDPMPSVDDLVSRGLWPVYVAAS